MENVEIKFDKMQGETWALMLVFDNVEDANSMHLQLYKYQTRLALKDNILTVIVYNISDNEILSAYKNIADEDLPKIKLITHLGTGYHHDRKLEYNPAVPVNLNMLQILE